MGFKIDAKVTFLSQSLKYYVKKKSHEIEIYHKNPMI